MTTSSSIETPLAVISRTDIERMFITGSMTSPKLMRVLNRRTLISSHPILSFLVVLALTFLPGGALQANEPADAGIFIVGLTDEVIQQVIEPEIDERERTDRLHALLSDVLAVETIGRFVLGRSWITATKNERAAFLDIFTKVMTAQFMPLLTTYSGERVQIGRVGSDPDRPALFTVASRLIRPQGEPVNVTWRVRYDGQEYRIVDIVIEGVSMALTLRSEYRSFIRQHSGRVGALIVALRERIAADESVVSPGPQASRQ